MAAVLGSSLTFAPMVRADDAAKKGEAKVADTSKKEMKDMDKDCDCKECKECKKDKNCKKDSKGHKKECAHCKMHHHDDKAKDAADAPSAKDAADSKKEKTAE